MTLPLKISRVQFVAKGLLFKMIKLFFRPFERTARRVHESLLDSEDHPATRKSGPHQGEIGRVAPFDGRGRDLPGLSLRVHRRLVLLEMRG